MNDRNFYTVYLRSGEAFTINKELIDDVQLKYGSAAIVEISRLVAEKYRLQSQFDEIYERVDVVVNYPEVHWVLYEFQGFVDKLKEELIDKTGVELYNAENSIRQLQSKMVSYLKDRGYYQG
jgi:hypothetical protein